MKFQVAGNSGPGPLEVEMMPTASPFVPPNQSAGTDVVPPRFVRGPVTPPVVTE
jgi:hypothetical protein